MTSEHLRKERRRAWVALIGVACILSMLGILYLAREVAHNNDKICAVVNSATSIPVDKPEDPGLDPFADREYDQYVKLSKLGKELKCRSGVSL